jgi:hypothetical protein
MRPVFIEMLCDSVAMQMQNSLFISSTQTLENKLMNMKIGEPRYPQTYDDISHYTSPSSQASLTDEIDSLRISKMLGKRKIQEYENDLARIFRISICEEEDTIDFMFPPNKKQKIHKNPSKEVHLIYDADYLAFYMNEQYLWNH